ncbi:excinuclease ABC subunit UvrB [bacterium]|nr:excinuclease ABC subunit UvrB [bacterium]
MFDLVSTYSPAGDQPRAIKELTKRVKDKEKNTVLLGVTGSGKTYTIANVVKEINKPTLVISHNKTLAGQLFQEFRDFFPNNAVEYFVSYYDYYQPESYIPSSDTYIEKEAERNDEIDRLRLSATTSLSTRKDVLVVASVSCIYNLGSPIEYASNIIEVVKGMNLRRQDLFLKLSDLQYERNDFELKRSTYKVAGDSINIYPSYEKEIVKFVFLENTLTNIFRVDPITGIILQELNQFSLFPAKHYVTAEERKEQGLKNMEIDLNKRIEELKQSGRVVEAYRLEQRTKHDIEMINEVGYCSGIENYSIYFDGRKQGDSPFTLLDFFPKDYLLVIDESHITVPQIGGMSAGDRSRKETLVEYGFRLPSALDNRPLNFTEFERRMGQSTIYTSATPGDFELTRIKASTSKKKGKLADKPEVTKQYFSDLKKHKGIIELIVRPTGLIDPEIEVKPTEGQIEDLIKNIKQTISKDQRVLVTTLTKRMSEELSRYIEDRGIKVAYLHSDIETLDRADILADFRKGTYDVVVGINLLREGLDLPEVSLVAILDADKEGFLRSDKSLIQTMGRAARNLDGRVIMYADKITGSMKRAMDEIERRRKIQRAYNLKHDITPTSIIKPFREVIIEREDKNKEKDYKAQVLKDSSITSEDMQVEDYEYKTMAKTAKKDLIKRLESQMKKLAQNLEFEKASVIRDKVLELKRIK